MNILQVKKNSDQSRIVEQTKFNYSPLGKTFKEKNK